MIQGACKNVLDQIFYNFYESGIEIRVFEIRENIQCNIDIVDDLKIKHTHADKIRAILKGEFKSIFGLYSAAGQYLERDNRHILLVKKVYGLFREQTEHIIMELVVV